LPRVARDRFDLEVEGAHSYFVGPFLVHNSHFDLRLGDPTTGEAHSWAMKKLPEPGKSTYAPQQPTHTVEYMDWKGEIPTGTYGAGTVELARRDKAEVLKAHDNEIRFNLYQGRTPEQFVMKRQTGRMWTIHNVTPSRDVKKWQELIPSDKPSMKNIPIGKISPANPTEVWQPKIDGAHAIAVLEPNKPMRLFSYREAKNQTGLIEHTFRMPNFYENGVPPGTRPTVLRGEIWGEKGGKPVHVSQLGGILNASVPESRKRQESEKIKLHFTAFDVERHEGKKIGPQPFERTDQILKDLAAQVSGIEVMPTAITTAQKQRLSQEVQSGHHKLTREGLVVRSREMAEAYKAKKFDPHDVFIQQVYPGTKPGEAGGFRYSWTEHGPIVGNVGSGLTHKQRQDMLQNPENWVGRAAKVLAQEKLRSGALRMPVFTGFHETKGLQPYHEIATPE
jgi:ATP-dependent DNA ligase